jgi:hypothetical protein
VFDFVDLEDTVLEVAQYTASLIDDGVEYGEAVVRGAFGIRPISGGNSKPCKALAIATASRDLAWPRPSDEGELVPIGAQQEAIRGV